MPPPAAPLSLLVLHNRDYQRQDPSSPGFASSADVEHAAADVATALRSRGHRVAVESIDSDGVPALLGRVGELGVELVFNLCESLDGDNRNEVVVPALLDLGGVAYTGSGPRALGLALQKDRTKEVLRARGVPTPEAVLVSDADPEQVARRFPLPFPLIVKPTREDGSVGIDRGSVVRDRAGLLRALERVVRGLGQPALCERFIEGREFYVSLLGNDPPVAMPFHEIDFSAMPAGLPRIVSYAGKWDPSSPEWGGTRATRCHLDEPIRARAEAAAVAAFGALGLRDYARVDLRLGADGVPLVIDVNPNCDLGASSGFPRAAGYAGIEYPDLLERICRLALARPRPPL